MFTRQVFFAEKQSLLVNLSTLELLIPLKKQTLMNSLEIFKSQASILAKPSTKLFKISISFGANDCKIARLKPFYSKTL